MNAAVPPPGGSTAHRERSVSGVATVGVSMRQRKMAAALLTTVNCVATGAGSGLVRWQSDQRSS